MSLLLHQLRFEQLLFWRAREAAVFVFMLPVLLFLLLGTACFAGLGLAASSVIRSAEGSSAVVNLILLPMAFLSGSFGPTEDYPSFLQAIGDVLPLKYVIDLIGAVYLDGDGVWSEPAAIAVVVAWGIAGLVVALRRFRWEPVER